MDCSKCSEPFTDDSTAACDRCGSILCQSCSCLTATEMRALALSKRTIIFLCPNCQNDSLNSQPCSYVTSDEVREIVSDAIMQLMTDIKSHMDLAQETARIGLDKLSREIDVLKSSNINLVRLFTNAPNGQTGGGARGLSSGFSGQPLNQSLVRTDSSAAASASPGTRRPQNTATGQKKSLSHHRDGSSSAGGASEVSDTVNGVDQSGASAPRSSSLSAKKSLARNHQRPVVIGSGKTASTKISAAVIKKRTSVFVGKLATHVTSDDLREYLRTTFNCEDNFNIEQLTVRSGSYNSFRIETDVNLLDQLFSADCWPEGVVVKKFRFFQQRRSTSGSRP